jgi:hypothetical protein
MTLASALVLLQSEVPEATIGEALMNIVGDPVSVVTFLFGALFLLASMGYFGYLSAGALVDFLVGDAMERRGGAPRRPQ